jgi:putative transposase
MGQLRAFEAGVSLHVIQRGNNKCQIFVDDLDHAWFLELMRRASERYDVGIHSFSLMSTHIHLLVTPRTDIALPRFMQQIGLRYVKYFNRKYQRIGALWNGRYRAKALRDVRYLLTCHRYIEQNPVRAHIVAIPEDYRWSSYAAHALGQSRDGIQPHPIYQTLGKTAEERQAAYRAICNIAVSAEDIVRIREP